LSNKAEAEGKRSFDVSSRLNYSEKASTPTKALSVFVLNIFVLFGFRVVEVVENWPKKH